jgi:dolichol-phosphate mannosyltransferase
VMLAALPVIMGVQFILGFLNYDIASVPTRPLHKKTLFRRRSNG